MSTVPTTQFDTREFDTELLLELLNRCGTPLFIKNREHRVLLANDSLCDLVGIAREDLLGKNDFDLYLPEEAAGFYESDERVFESGVEIEYEEVITDSDGVAKHLRTRKNVYETASGEQLLVGTLHDLTELYVARGKLEDAVNDLSVTAMTDPLTGTSNRCQFEKDLETQVQQRGQANEAFTLMYLDLNGFKIINDTAGHHIGDEILRHCAQRLENEVRGDARIARIGGDEFVVLLPQIDESEALEIVKRIVAVFDKPINIGGALWLVGCSIGAAVFPQHGKTGAELIRNADFAMYEAKKNMHKNKGNVSSSSVKFFQSDIGKSMERKRRIECALNFTNNSQKIEQHYQPIVARNDSREVEIVGFESLARWELDGENVSPEEFVPTLEKTGEIVAFGYQVLESACRYVAEHCTGQQFVSVNLCYKQIVEKDFCARVENIIRRAGVSPCSIALELTEHDAGIQTSVAVSVLSRLRKFGVKTMLDDFGCGYSNLSRLCELPIDIVKIDKSILRQGPLLLASVLKLIQNMKFETIVEGVETEAQSKCVEELGGNMMQGYYFGRPAAGSFDWNRRSSDSPILCPVVTPFGASALGASVSGASVSGASVSGASVLGDGLLDTDAASS